MTDSPELNRVNYVQRSYSELMLLLDFLLPRSCVFCGLESQGIERSICALCIEDMDWIEPASAPAPGVFECSIAMLHYSFPIDAAIKALKFRRKLHYAPAFSEILCTAIPLLPNDISAVLPVPLHWRREAMRGFNQAREIARPVAKRLEVPIVRGVYRSKATSFQTGLHAAERSRNLRDAFKVRRKIAFEHVLIVDDVVTTGATTRSLAKALLAAGVSRVSLIVIARAS